jgi:GT2 family glycosyltransferase
VTAPLPVSVVIPSLGRSHLRTCLESLARCEPRAEEIVVALDPLGDTSGSAIVAGFAAAGARATPAREAGIPAVMNHALREARMDFVLLTNDDCTVDPSWVGAAWRHLQDDPGAIWTGRVLSGGDTAAVLSTIDQEEAEDFSGRITFSRLYTGNAAFRRSDVLELGAFDERIRPAASDNDLCYRWLRAGRRLRYEPDMIVWHLDWRGHEELERRYREYARGQGVFYAKHLRQGDLRMLRHIARDLRGGLRGALAGALRPDRPRWRDPRQGILSGLPRGLLDGWREYAKRGE